MDRVNFKNHEFFNGINNFKLAGTKNGTPLIVSMINQVDGSIYSNQDNKIIDFQNYKNELHIQKAKVKDNIKLSVWLRSFHSDDELREVFINMDLAMKYIHEKGYCIKSFDPKDIEILNNSLKQIKYNTLLEMPNNLYDKKELIKEDIYSSSFLQIGIYTKCLAYMNPSFLKENFDSFAIFLPSEDVAYYKGIVQRGASVYFSEYVVERKKRDLKVLEDEIGDTSNSNQRGRSLVKTNGRGYSNYDLVDQNITINESIYSQLNNKEAAFINYVIFPIIIILLGFLTGILIYTFSFV